jgi:hypothetical protein
LALPDGLLRFARNDEGYNPLIIPASISSRLKRLASAPFLQS